MYIELESEHSEDAVKLFRTYLASERPVEFTVCKAGNAYRVRAVRVEDDEKEIAASA